MVTESIFTATTSCHSFSCVARHRDHVTHVYIKPRTETPVRAVSGGGSFSRSGGSRALPPPRRGFYTPVHYTAAAPQREAQQSETGAQFFLRRKSRRPQDLPRDLSY